METLKYMPQTSKLYPNKSIPSVYYKSNPDKKPSIKTVDDRELIFCVIRKKWVIITPEEWVRQNFLLYLIEIQQYPASLIAVEKQLMLGELKKRFDIVVYREEKPYMLIECKEINVPITDRTMEQVLRYNLKLNAAFYMLTNGRTCYGFSKQNGRLESITAFPVFKI